MQKVMFAQFLEHKNIIFTNKTESDDGRVNTFCRLFFACLNNLLKNSSFMQTE